LPTEKSVNYEPKNIADLSDFLKANKDNFHEIWIVLIKKEQANPQPLSFKEAVSKAIELGLVDSRTRSIDEKKYAIRFTKRKDRKN